MHNLLKAEEGYIIPATFMLSSGGFRISLDRKEPGSDIDFVSHAHTDHLAAVKHSEWVLASSQTADLIAGSYGLKPRVPDGAPVPPGLKLLGAGHMLGSRQLYVDACDSGESVVYTGDFQMQDSRVSEKIEIPSSDIAILDSTYPDPGVHFGDRSEVERDIQRWASAISRSGIVLFRAYAMGKSQELISILNEAGMAPVVSERIAAVCSVYKKHGAKLDYLSTGSEECDSELRGNFIGITESGADALPVALGVVHAKHVFTAVVTGFAKMFRFDTDMQFPLSDHADFSQSVDYINATGARKVFTYGNSAELFAANLRSSGIDARPFTEYQCTPSL